MASESNGNGNGTAVEEPPSETRRIRPAPAGPGPRFLVYAHGGVGLGHTRRGFAIAQALLRSDPTSVVLMATGVDEASRLGVPANVGILKLPSLQKVANGAYAGRRLRIPPGEVLELRASILEAATRTFRPDVVLVDKHPLGVGGELLPALKVAKANGAAAVLGLRDILDNPEQVAAEWGPQGLPAGIARHYDRVLVYGEPAVYDAVREYSFPPEVVRLSESCGYVVHAESGAPTDLDAAEPPVRDERPLVLATPGGGEDGAEMLEMFVEAASGAPWKGVVVTGPMAPHPVKLKVRRLCRAAGVEFHAFVPRLSAWFDQVDALVCMGGYNTIAEALQRATPTVCIPRTRPRTEQLIRASALDRIGLLRSLPPAVATPERLREEVLAATNVDRADLRRRLALVADFDGASRAAGRLLDLARARPGIGVRR